MPHDVTRSDRSAVTLGTQGNTPSSPREAEVEPGARIGRYIVLYRIGTGGMGRVYAAHDPDLDRRVAVKVLTPHRKGKRSNAHARMLREAQALARLSHPNVVAVHDVGEWQGRVWLAMDLLDGPTLRGFCEERARTWAEIVDIYAQAAEGLAAAHLAGLVHRDFKPDNAIVGRDGRVQVLDFGLARITTPTVGSEDLELDGADASEAPGRMAAPLTRAGALVGTPGYMAPEQVRREDVDARTDQFALCLALYEAVYGESPFAGEDRAGMRTALLAGRVNPPPAAARVPGWLRRVLLRGLAVDPHDRYATMAELIADLRRDRVMRRRRRLATAVTALSVAMAAWGAVAVAQRDADRCGDAMASWGDVWSVARKQEVRAAFEATGKPYAAASWSTVTSLLDGYAARWVDMRTSACRATWVEGTQTEAMLWDRFACLESRRDDAQALVELFAEADGRIVERAVQATHDLLPVDACGDPATAPLPDPIPMQAAARDRARSIRAQLVSVRALERAGHYAEGVELARQVLADARDLAFLPVQAEALAELGVLSVRNGDSPGAVTSLQEAIFAAEAGGHPRAAARAWVALLGAAYVRPDLHDRVDEWERHAAALLEHLGEPPDLAARLHYNLGMLRDVQGRYDEAVKLHERAIEIEARHRGETPDLGSTLVALGNALTGTGRFADAAGHHERALQILERQLGPEHPDVGSAVTGLAITYDELGRDDETPALYARAVEIFRGALGPGHPKVATALNNHASVLYAQGHYAEALQRFGEAAKIWTDLYGPDHPDVALTLGNIGLALDGLGRYDEALAEHERSLAVREKVWGPDHPDVAVALVNLGDLHAMLEHWPDARRHYERALQVLEAALGPDHPRVATALLGVGAVDEGEARFVQALSRYRRALAIRRRALGDLHEGVAEALTRIGAAHRGAGSDAAAMLALEEALQIYEHTDADEDVRAEARYQLARASWSRPAEREAARRLREQALASLDPAVPGNRPLRGEIEAWAPP